MLLPVSAWVALPVVAFAVLFEVSIVLLKPWIVLLFCDMWCVNLCQVWEYGEWWFALDFMIWTCGSSHWRVWTRRIMSGLGSAYLKPAQLIISHSTAKNTVISSITMPASRIRMPRRYWMTKVNKQFGSSSSTTSTPSNGSIGEDETKRKRASNEKASRQGYALSYCTKQLLPLGYLLTPGIKMYNM